MMNMYHYLMLEFKGKYSSIEKRFHHPVIHVSWNDANAFCHYHGLRLPTESEWEYAARGGLEQNIFPWGDNRMSDSREHLANIFQVS